MDARSLRGFGDDPGSAEFAWGPESRFNPVPPGGNLRLSIRHS